MKDNKKTLKVLSVTWLVLYLFNFCCSFFINIINGVPLKYMSGAYLLKSLYFIASIGVIVLCAFGYAQSKGRKGLKITAVVLPLITVLYNSATGIFAPLVKNIFKINYYYITDFLSLAVSLLGVAALTFALLYLFKAFKDSKALIALVSVYYGFSLCLSWFYNIRSLWNIVLYGGMQDAFFNAFICFVNMIIAVISTATWIIFTKKIIINES